MSDKIPLDLPSKILKLIANLLSVTWRYRVVDKRENFKEKPQGEILAVWHEYILPMAIFYKDKDTSCIASGSKDGRRLASILQAWNFTTLLGSPRKDGTKAVRAGIREIKNGKNLIITPDGPKGPRQNAKNGIALISIMAKTDIVPIIFYPKRYWRLTSWDKFIIPKPFTTITIEYQDTISPKNISTDKEDIAKYIKLIEKSITPKDSK